MLIPPEPPDDPGLDELLRQLPAPKAPASLAHHVLRKIEERNRNVAWWQQPVTRWPLAARATLFAASALIAGLFLLLIEPSSTPLNTLVGSIQGAPVWGVTRALGDAAQSVLRTIPSTVWWTLGAVAVASYLGCVSVGGWLYRQWLSGGREIKTWGDAWL